MLNSCPGMRHVHPPSYRLSSKDQGFTHRPMNVSLPTAAVSKDFVLSPIQGVLDQRVPRRLEFGKPRPLPMGLDDGRDEKLDQAVSHPMEHGTAPHETTLLDFFAMVIASHMIGVMTQSPMLGHAVDAGMEFKHMAEGANHAAQRTAGMNPVMAVDLAAQIDPSLVFMPNGKAMPIPTLTKLGTKLDATEEQRKQEALASPSSGTRSVVRFGKRGSSWA